MTPTTSLTTPLNPRAATPRRDQRAVRLARYGAPGEPPAVDEVTGDDAGVIEELFNRVASACGLPPLAVREVIENLIHADFEGASVSIFDDGASIRVSDCGPGIADKDRAVQPGYSTACERTRTVVRGVGSGLPVAITAMEAAGGALELSDNLRGGTVVTLTTPASHTGAARATDLNEHARRIMALLVELGPAGPAAIAKELGIALGECGRELVLLEYRGLVDRSPDGTRSLTDTGTELLETLF